METVLSIAFNILMILPSDRKVPSHWMKIFDWQSSDQETMSPQKDYLLLMSVKVSKFWHVVSSMAVKTSAILILLIFLFYQTVKCTNVISYLPQSPTLVHLVINTFFLQLIYNMYSSYTVHNVGSFTLNLRNIITIPNS